MDKVMKRLLNVKEAAEYLNISRKTIYNWVSEERLPTVRLGRCLRFDLNKINELIKKNSIDTHSIH